MLGWRCSFSQGKKTRHKVGQDTSFYQVKNTDTADSLSTRDARVKCLIVIVSSMSALACCVMHVSVGRARGH